MSPSTTSSGIGVIRVPYVGRPAYWMAERNWLALGATALFLGWCVVTVFPCSRRSEDTPDDDQDRPTSGSGSLPQPAFAPGRRRGRRRCRRGRRLGRPRRRRLQEPTANPVSTFAAATNFWPYSAAVLARLAVLLLAPRRDDWHRHQRRGSWRPRRHVARPDRHVQGRLAPRSPPRAPTGQSLGLTIAGINANNSVAGPATFSVEAWVKSTSTTGGRFLGFGNQTGQNPSTTVDRAALHGAQRQGLLRHRHREDQRGQQQRTQQRRLAPRGRHLRDRHQRHEAVRRRRPPGSDRTATAQNFTGYWRAGAEQITGWTGNPTDDYFEGSLDEIAVYTDVLSPAEVWRTATPRPPDPTVTQRLRFGRPPGRTASGGVQHHPSSDELTGCPAKPSPAGAPARGPNPH